jgi:uracil-DNA glycosylase
MAKKDPQSAADFVPRTRSLDALAGAAAECRGCPLWRDATQAVFGEGPRSADMMLVGEQPGDREDIAGAPFVGPAGAVLDQALAEAGIDRGDTYLTNAVKHFKWKPRGPRRIHQTPRVGEIEACRPWLEAEIAAVKPRALIALGATATRSLFGPKPRVMRDRGRPLETELAEVGAITIHPSAVLRADRAEREAARQGMVEDLAAVAAAIRR